MRRTVSCSCGLAPNVRDVALADHDEATQFTRAGGPVSRIEMSHEEFEDLVRDAMDSLPEWTVPILEELAVLVEDAPKPGTTRPGTTLLGLYRGIPVTAHGGRVPGSIPGTITLYRLPILAACARREDVSVRVLKVLGHEVRHAMGISETELCELGWF